MLGLSIASDTTADTHGSQHTSSLSYGSPTHLTAHMPLYAPPTVQPSLHITRSTRPEDWKNMTDPVLLSRGAVSRTKVKGLPGSEPSLDPRES